MLEPSRRRHRTPVRTPYERVREVISRVYTPVSADAVADTACTLPKTARKHLKDLNEEVFDTTGTGKNSGTTYRRSLESLIAKQASDIRDHVSTDELGARVSEMQAHIRDLQTEYSAESPESLTGKDIDSETVRKWKTTRRNLAFASATLAIESDWDTEPEPDETSNSD